MRVLAKAAVFGLARCGRQLAVDRCGAIAAFIALAIVPLIGFIGVGTDTARAFMVKSRLSTALDAAGLAGGKAFFSASRDADMTMFFNANFPAGYLGATISGPAFVVDTANEKIQLTASATVPTTFMRLFGQENVTVAASAEISRQEIMLDVVLSIDMSGSMTTSSGGTTRIAAARTAASTLVEILFGDNATNPLLKIGLVPWNSKVNVMIEGQTYHPASTLPQSVAPFIHPVTGAGQSTVYYADNTPVPLLSSPPTDWKGCVYSRFIDDEDTATDADIFDGPVTTTGADWPAWEPIGPEGEPVSGSARCTLAIGYNECGACLEYGITPLQNDKQPILDAIGDLLSPAGNTNIPQGLGWAWRVLTPGSPFTEAVLNPPYRRQQAIVLLTDGENYGGSGDGYKGVFGIGSTARPDMDARLRLLAANIKASGVILYVIQFANSGSTLQVLLKEVASGPDAPYYHNAPDAAALQAAFHEIANNLSELRLSK
ncbi:MAG: VWA domain-containing protein [Rhodospirillales bacterium]|nr:VWA domain-containing protein [Rhodospirillales bacterium]